MTSPLGVQDDAIRWRLLGAASDATVLAKVAFEDPKEPEPQR